MIKITNLQKKYTTDEVETTALAGIDLHIQKGEFIAIMGPSGCGKSTLLNIIGLLDNPTSGSFIFLGQEIAQYPENRRADFRKAHIGFVFQSFNLIDELTVFENVELPLIYSNISAAERKTRVEQILTKMEIGHRKNHFPLQLSGGQQQRVAIARAIITQPKLILADEPTGNLDSKHGQDVMTLLQELNNAGTTIIMVTHSAADAAFSHRVVNLLDGQIISENIKQLAIL